MRFSFLLRWLPAAAAIAAGAAVAQSATPGAARSANEWRSAFDGYQSFADAPVASWRESNDTVGRIGGWRVYAREAAGAASAPALPAAPAAPGRTPPPAPGAGGATGHRH